MIDLSDIDTVALVQELVRRLGKDAALIQMASAREIRREEDAESLRESLRDALSLLADGKTEKGMHDLRMLAAEPTNILDWQAIKEGKHPFLSLAREGR